MHTVIPSVKGQVTIPAEIRKKYKIGKSTPLIVEDEGEGIIKIKVMTMLDPDSVEYYETKEGCGLKFKNGIDPQILIDAIDAMYGQD